MSYEVRRLKTKDLFKLADILDNCWTEIQQVTSKEKDPQTAGIAVIRTGLKYARVEMVEFLAELVGMTTEQLEDEPYDAILSIVEAVDTQDDLPGFFKRVQALASKFRKVAPKD